MNAALLQLDQGQLILFYGLIVAFLVLSLSLHEMAHGWVALKCGDPTARDLGRLTPDPRVHIDPVMTIALPAILLIVSKGTICFGGAKPVPVNTARLRHPARDMMFVALAGPATNLVLAVLFLLADKLLLQFGVFGPRDIGHLVLYSTARFNVLLAVFNMFPIPPLDGSRVVAYFLPARVREAYVALETIGMLLVFGVIFTPIGRRILFDGTNWLFRVVDRITGFAQA